MMGESVEVDQSLGVDGSYFNNYCDIVRNVTLLLLLLLLYSNF